MEFSGFFLNFFPFPPKKPLSKNQSRILGVEPNWKRIKKAAEVKAWYPVAYADAFCIVLGMEMNAPIITGDPEFKKVKEIELIWVGA